MSQRIFGLGNLYLIAPGSLPVQVGILQDVSFDFKATQKDLIGQLQVAVDSARAEVKVSGKVKYGEFNGALLSAMLAGSTTATGSQIGIAGESGTIPANPGPYTVTAAHAAKWISDLGVYDATTKIYMKRVTGTPTTGEYSVAAGVYTFAAADAGHIVSLAYDYTSDTLGSTITYKNQLMGTTTFFAMKLYNNFTDSSGVSNSGLYIPKVHFPDLALALKKDDWTMSDTSWSAIADADGTICKVFAGN